MMLALMPTIEASGLRDGRKARAVTIAPLTFVYVGLFFSDGGLKRL